MAKRRCATAIHLLAGTIVIALVTGATSLAPVAHAAPADSLVVDVAGGRITVATSDYPSSGWQVVFDDARNGGIAQFHLAAVSGGADLLPSGPGPRATLFDKTWADGDGPHWLSGAQGTEGVSVLAEATPVRARVVQTVNATGAAPGTTPASLRVIYTLYPAGRIVIDADWTLNDAGVVDGAPPFGNAWILALADQGYNFGQRDGEHFTAFLDPFLPSFPELLFTAVPVFHHDGVARSLADPDVRATYCPSPDPFQIVSDPFSVIAGAVLTGAAEVANPYQAGSEFRHVFVVDWSRGGPGELAEAVRSARDLATPDPLDGSAGAGRMETGSIFGGDPADLDGDGWVEGEGCYAVNASLNRAQILLDPRRGASESIPFRGLTFKVHDFPAEHDSLVLLLSSDEGATWSELAKDVDYRLTTHAEEGEVGADTRIFTLLRDLPDEGAPDATLWLVESASLITATLLSGPYPAAAPDGVEIGWRVRRAGIYRRYEIWRQPLDGGWTCLTVPALADETPSEGRDYRWVDGSARGGTWYRYRLLAYPPGGGEPVVMSAGAPVRAPGSPVLAGTSGVVAFPNPFHPGAAVSRATFAWPRAPEAEAERIFLYDSAGRRIRALHGSRGDGGALTAPWDGMDGDGRPLASGIYFVRCEGCEAGSTVKIILNR